MRDERIDAVRICTRAIVVLGAYLVRPSLTIPALSVIVFPGW